jgi:hypothetical protein
VIHQRDAWDDTLEILKSYTGRLRGVFHCFGNTPEQAREILALWASCFVHRHRDFSKMQLSFTKPLQLFRWTHSWWKPTAPTWHQCHIGASAANQRTRSSWRKKSPQSEASRLRRSLPPPHARQSRSSASAGDKAVLIYRLHSANRFHKLRTTFKP